MSNTFGQFHAESLKFDKRLIQMNKKSGVLQPGEYEKSKEALPDLQHNAAPLNIKGDSASTNSEEVAATPETPQNDSQNPMQESEPSAFTSPAAEDEKPKTSGGGGFFGM